jgi:hypothetical protein
MKICHSLLAAVFLVALVASGQDLAGLQDGHLLIPLKK